MVLTVLFLISFLMHLLLILAVVVLFQRRSVERMNVPTMNEDVQTIHSSIEAFVDEMEKENGYLYEQLVQHVQEKEERNHKDIRSLQDRIAGLEREISQLHENGHVSKNQRMESTRSESDQYEHVRRLHAQGFSNADIAKLLRIGNGEVQFITNMQRDKGTL